MENLEIAVKESIGEEDTKQLGDRPIYEGLQRVEEITYHGPTSIKYWM